MLRLIRTAFLLILFLAACNDATDAPRTPTVAITPTLIVQAVTPSATASATRTPTQSPTPTLTASATHTPRPTNTHTATTSATHTPRPTNTHTATASATRTPTQSPTPTLTASATRTPHPSATRTPRPTNTHTATASATRTPTQSPTISPSPQFELNRTATPAPLAEIEGEGTETGITGGVEASPIPFASITPLPTFAPQIPPTFTPFAGVSNTQQTITVSDGVIVVPPPAQAPGRLFTTSPGGASATFAADNELYINGALLTISPSSAFGMPDHMWVADMEWTRDGRFLAFIINGDPNQTDQIGVWVLDTWNNASQQIFRGDDRRAFRVNWSPDGSVVLIHMTTPAGNAFTFLPSDHNANNGFRMHPYPYAEWAGDGRSVVVSGRAHDGAWVLGRVMLDFDQTFVGYDTGGIPFVHGAGELGDGRLAFLGAAAYEGAYRLYALRSDSPPQALSGEIIGAILDAQWSANRRGLLVLTDQRRLWLVRADGSLRDVTPSEGVPTTAFWR